MDDVKAVEAACMNCIAAETRKAVCRRRVSDIFLEARVERIDF